MANVSMITKIVKYDEFIRGFHQGFNLKSSNDKSEYVEVIEKIYDTCSYRR